MELGIAKEKEDAIQVMGAVAIASGNVQTNWSLQDVN